MGMDPINVLVKIDKTRNEANKGNLLSLCLVNKIKIFKIFENPKGFKLILSHIDEAEKIFTEKTLMTLKNSGFEPLLPNIITSKRTIFARNTDPSILEHSNDDIFAEIN